MKGKEEIEKLEAEHLMEPHLRKLQKELAKEITNRVHSEEDFNKAVEITEIFFNGTIDDLKKMSVEDISTVHQSLDKNAFSVNKSELFASGINILDLISIKTAVFSL